MRKDVVLTGLRSNSEFHLGNYLGAIQPMVELQKKHAGKYQLNMFVPDLHSFTTPINHDKLYDQTIQNLRVFVAAGLDINNADTFIYRQSYIPAHSELTWILDCFTGFGEAGRMAEFKDKASRMKGQVKELFDVINDRYGKAPTTDDAIEGVANDNITVGLFNYPVLMAADILLYGAKWIPVGDDQRQHVEFTRNLAVRMNNKFGELFVVPEDNVEQTKFAGRDEPVRIRSLRNPEKKMSKSVDDPAGTILLTDTPEAAAKKVMEATTDSVGVVNYDWDKQPGVTNLLQILALLAGTNQDGVNKKWQGRTSYGELKSTVADEVKRFLTELQGKLSKINDMALTKKLEADEGTVGKVAAGTLLKVQKAVGLRPRG